MPSLTSLIGLFAILPLNYAAAKVEPWLNARAPQAGSSPDPCQVINEVISSCEAAMPNFTELSIPDQANCVCYVDGSFVGDGFDNEVYSCVSELVAQGDTSDASDIAALTTFCSYAGSGSTSAFTSAASSPASASAVQPSSTAAPSSASESAVQPPSPTMIASSPAITPTPTPTPAPSNPNDPCSEFVSYIDFCENLSPGFTDFPPVTQAGCLCYSYTTWVPNFFDGFASSCASEIYVAGSTSEAAGVAIFSDFCSSVGDVGNPPTVTSAGGTPVPIQSIIGGLSGAKPTPARGTNTAKNTGTAMGSATASTAVHPSNPTAAANVLSIHVSFQASMSPFFIIVDC
jgi:hypothetical protein